MATCVVLDREGDPVTEWLGYRAHTHARSTGGGLVVTVDATGWVADVVDEGGRWMTVCDQHSTNCHHPVLRNALAFMRSPEVWCEFCAAIVQGEGS